MSDVFFDTLDIPRPNYNLGVGSGSHGRQTADMMRGLEEVLEKESPNLLLVYGDTNSTLAGALVAAKMGIPLGHVEAGLRSFNRQMPEEVNRVVADHLSSLLFAPTETAVENLTREGITRGVHMVGDVMYDVALQSAQAARSRDILSRLGLTRGEYLLVTLHRPQNVDDQESLSAIVEARPRREARRVPGPPAHSQEPRRLRLVGPPASEGQGDRAGGLPGLHCPSDGVLEGRHGQRRGPEGGLLLRRTMRHAARRDGVDRDPGGRLERPRRDGDGRDPPRDREVQPRGDEIEVVGGWPCGGEDRTDPGQVRVSAVKPVPPRECGDRQGATASLQ